MLKSVESTITSILDYEKDIEKQASPIVIMFSDLVGSTRYKAKNPVIDGLKRVFTYCKICANAITTNGATVVKYIGDEVMAIFTGADEALAAAITIHDVLENLHFNPKFECKTAIHAGEVFFFKYPEANILDPQGTTVDLAARIISTTKPRQILISE